jgi:hypothetical protein
MSAGTPGHGVPLTNTYRSIECDFVFFAQSAIFETISLMGTSP